MKSHIKICLTFFMLFGLFSCSKKSNKAIANFDSYHLVVVSHTNDGDLLDYIAFTDLSGIQMIRIKPKQGHKDINVTLYGSKRHEALKTDAAVISKAAPGYKGCVEVSVQNGIATGSMGNGANMPSPVTNVTLEEVSNRLERDMLQSDGNDSIEVTKNQAQQVVAPDR